MAVSEFRKRYIAFVLDTRVSRKEMIKHLNKIGRENGIRITLTVFEGDRGIVLVGHKEQKTAIEAMNSCSELGIRTLKTSGTIRKAKSYLV